MNVMQGFFTLVWYAILGAVVALALVFVCAFFVRATWEAMAFGWGVLG